ncbi:HAMP domain-containing sensor histidine kinase [Aurantiacibacter sp. MUD11]|uniref:sensor histidine kinase n=1 Tax=Aurantiacibacter sp. MUD11 TaxID=3003265 RepID=UPI0022AA057E|nr:HAMP domain-containing sensor histidine kinase [Aurantiacibacter sp. MUD11]WAT19175.1 HAMP domain-containing sensor histidine kinase [Aurantiacibacter sp. MUD11]
MNADVTTASGSLRLRFIFAITVWVALGIGGIWFTATRVFATHIEEMYHEELEVHVRELARLTQIDDSGAPRLSRPLSDPRYEVPLSGFYWQVSVPNQPVLKSASMTRGSLDESVAHSPNVAHEIEDGPTGPTITYGMIMHTPEGDEVHVVIATDQSELDEDIASFNRDLTAWLTSLALLLLLTGAAIISFGLRPLTRLGRAIARVRNARAERLEGSYPSEIAPLVTDLNAYIRSNADIVSRARVQAGNLAHSLRTPLAVITDEAERLSEREHCEDSGKVLLQQAEAMQNQIDYQLARTRSAAGARAPGNRAKLPELVEPILKAMRRLHPNTVFRSEVPRDPVVLAVDPIGLAELLSILLDNAGKWARGEVRLAVARVGEAEVRITVSDDGPGMTEEQIAHACDIGSRFDSMVPGSGLGLAIAREICADNGSELEFSSTSAGLSVSAVFKAV